MLLVFTPHTRAIRIVGDAFLKTTETEKLRIRLLDESGNEFELGEDDTLEFTLKPQGQRDTDPLTINGAAALVSGSTYLYEIEVNAYTELTKDLLGLGDSDVTTDLPSAPCDAALTYTPDGEDPIESDTFSVTLKPSVPLDTDGTPEAAQVMSGVAAKTTPVNADKVPIIDSEAGNIWKTVTWANIKATLKTYFDTLYVGGTTAWGAITGTLSNQTDLNSALTAKASASTVSTHIADTANPHAVTKTQVGLGNVPNTDCTNASNLSTGTVAAARMPALTGPITTSAGAVATSLADSIQLALSDTTSDLVAETVEGEYWAPAFAGTLTGVVCDVGTAPTGAALITDVKKNGTTVFSTKVTIDATETSSRTAASPVISVSSFAAGDRFTFVRDQVGASVAGKAHQITLYYTRTS